jgi:hypothetical protein
VEMTVAWTSQTDVHTPLEISHRPRDSHIPTAAPRLHTRRHEPWSARFVPRPGDSSRRI